MTTVHDLCSWINILGEGNLHTACLGEIPRQVSNGLKPAVHASLLTAPDFLTEKLDFLLAPLPAFPPDGSDLSDLAGATLARLSQRGSVLFVLTAGGGADRDSHHTRLQRFLTLLTADPGTPLRINASVQLDDLGWSCHLASREPGPLALRPLPAGWDAPPGDLMMRALNGSAAAADCIQRLEPRDPAAAAAGRRQIFQDLLPIARKIANHHYHLHCPGWSHIPLSEGEVCLISGLVSRPGQTVLKRRVSGKGRSWHEAAALMTCEAIERIADAQAPCDRLAGVAFGLTEQSAKARALLEFFERFHFSRSFIDRHGATPLDFSNTPHLATLARDLDGYNGKKHLFLLSNETPFKVVLALAETIQAGNPKRMTYGLGCAFEIEAAAESAILETVQVHDYCSTAQRLSALETENSIQGLQSHRFWNACDHAQYLQDLSASGRAPRPLDSGPLRPLPAAQDGQRLEAMTRWCRDQDITVHFETLFSSASGQNGLVVRATCTDLPTTLADQPQLMASPEIVPFPISKTAFRSAIA